MRYFLADILQFQFHRALSQTAGCTLPLNRCSIYESKAAGERLNAMLAMGQSQAVARGARGADRREADGRDGDPRLLRAARRSGSTSSCRASLSGGRPPLRVLLGECRTRGRRSRRRSAANCRCRRRSSSADTSEPRRAPRGTAAHRRAAPGPRIARAVRSSASAPCVAGRTSLKASTTAFRASRSWARSRRSPAARLRRPPPCRRRAPRR